MATFDVHQPEAEGAALQEPSSPKRRNLVRRLFAHLADGLRVLAFLTIRPAALYLPRSWALAMADAAGFVIYLTPVGAHAREFARVAFPSGDGHARRALDGLRRPFRDYVIVARIVAGREDVARWPTESRNAPAILSDPNQSFILATGHFSREAMGPVYLRRTVAQPLSIIVAPIDRHSLRPRALRIRLQLGEMTNAIRRLREGDVDMGDVGEPGFAGKMIRRLSKPGNAVLMSTDVPWHKATHGGHNRPFAGFATQHFALGTARLARLSQCPIVTCVPFLDDEGRVIIEWGDPIPPPDKRDDSADERITDMILDVFERAIGRRPEQYVLPIGLGRSWDPKTERWISSPDLH